MISIYNRYSAYGGTAARSGNISSGNGRQPQQRNTAPQSAGRSASFSSMGNQRQNTQNRTPVKSVNNGGGILSGLLPKNIDISDIMLAAVLFLLYLDSHDEDFLIILVVVAFSMLKSGDE